MDMWSAPSDLDYYASLGDPPPDLRACATCGEEYEAADCCLHGVPPCGCGCPDCEDEARKAHELLDAEMRRSYEAALDDVASAGAVIDSAPGVRR